MAEYLVTIRSVAVKDVDFIVETSSSAVAGELALHSDYPVHDERDFGLSKEYVIKTQRLDPGDDLSKLRAAIKQLIETSDDLEVSHKEIDELLVNYIDDPEITLLFEERGWGWYA